MKSLQNFTFSPNTDGGYDMAKRIPAQASRGSSQRNYLHSDNSRLSALADRQKLTAATWPEPVKRGKAAELSAVEQDTDPWRIVERIMWSDPEGEQ